ncbi:EamA family transporter [Sulfurimonas sp. HSL1-2]|uniref:EamA family transporter n=1 Tax=Thiomicrolovo zhangzhouensis TaxID=3131933 RepID=UPI0031FA2D6C
MSLAILATAFGQYSFKRYKMTRRGLFIAVALTLFVLTPVLSFCALKQIPVDTVYMFTSLTILVVLLLSHFSLKETIPFQKLIGAGFILAGVVLYGIQ